MTQTATTLDLIMEAITHHPGCALDELVTVCPTLTWNQVFLEVDRLSRDGFLRLALVAPGRYTVVIPTEGKFQASQLHDVP